MNHRKRKFLSFLLVLIMIFGIIPAGVFASEEGSMYEVHFNCEPKDASASVFSDGKEIEHVSGDSHVFRLAPGEYKYAVSCSGYQQHADKLTVSSENVNIKVSLNKKEDIENTDTEDGSIPGAEEATIDEDMDPADKQMPENTLEEIPQLPESSDITEASEKTEQMEKDPEENGEKPEETEEEQDTEETPETVEKNEEQPAYAAQTLQFSGEDYSVLVSFGSEACIPDGAYLSVKEIKKDNPEYAFYYDNALEAVNGNPDRVASARFFDICILVSGEEMEPKSAVNVQITYDRKVSNEGTDAHAVHFADERDVPEVLDVRESNNDKSFEFQTDSFSVVGIIIEREMVSGQATVKWAVRRAENHLNNGEIVSDTTIIVKEAGEYGIKTKGNVDEKIPVGIGANGADGSDGISLSSAEFEIANTDPAPEQTSLFGNLYIVDESDATHKTFQQVSFVKIDRNGTLIPCDANGQPMMSGTFVLVTDDERINKEVEIRSVRTVTDRIENSTKFGEIIWYDAIGDRDGSNDLVKAMVSFNFQGYDGDCFKLTDYVTTGKYYYVSDSREVNKYSRGYCENAAAPTTTGDIAQVLHTCEYMKLNIVDGVATVVPCDKDGVVQDASANVGLYAVTDELYRFVIYANEMVKEHGEDDGKAYFWLGNKYYHITQAAKSAGKVNTSIQNGGKSADVALWAVDDYNTPNPKYRDGGHINPITNFDPDLQDTLKANVQGNTFVEGTNEIQINTGIVQKPYYLTGRVGDSYKPDEAVLTNGNPDNEKELDDNHLKTILYAASGTKATTINATGWDSTWNGSPLNGNERNESLYGWHTNWMNVGAHSSEYGDRDCVYLINDYLVLDSSWDKILNFVISSENSTPVLNGQLFGDTKLYPMKNHQRNSVQLSGNNLVYVDGYGTENDKLELVVARDGLIKPYLWKVGLTFNGSNISGDLIVKHLQLRANANVITTLNGQEYEGTFEYVSGNVLLLYDNHNPNPEQRAISNVLTGNAIVSGTQVNDNTLKEKVQEYKLPSHSSDWHSLPKSNDQESDWVEFDKDRAPSGKDSQGRPYIFNSDYVAISVIYTLKGIMKPVMSDGTINPDESTWIYYEDRTDGNYDEHHQPALKSSIDLNDRQLEEAYYACPNSGGYDVILDANAALRSEPIDQPFVTVYKDWSDFGYSAVRPTSITVTIERKLKTSSEWADYRTVDLQGDNAYSQWNSKLFIEKTEENLYDYRIKTDSEVLNYASGETGIQYSTTYSGMTVTNKANVQTSGIKGVKKWQSADGTPVTSEDGIPDQITLSLYQKKQTGDDSFAADDPGLQYMYKIISKSQMTDKSAWEWSFSDLPKQYVIKENDEWVWKDYIYTVVETNITENGKNVTDDYHLYWREISAADGFEYNNRHKPLVSFHKVASLAGQEPVMSGIRFTLISDSETRYLVSDAGGDLCLADAEYTPAEPAVKQFVFDFDTEYTLTEINPPEGFQGLSETFKYNKDKPDGYSSNWGGTWKTSDNVSIITNETENPAPAEFKLKNYAVPPALSITKYVNGEDANTQAEAVPVVAGTTAEYSVKVEQTVQGASATNILVKDGIAAEDVGKGMTIDGTSFHAKLYAGPVSQDILSSEFVLTVNAEKTEYSIQFKDSIVLDKGNYIVITYLGSIGKNAQAGYILNTAKTNGTDFNTPGTDPEDPTKPKPIYDKDPNNPMDPDNPKPEPSDPANIVIRETGNLKVEKIVAGNAYSPIKKFRFTVTLSGESVLNGDFGGMTFQNNIAVFELAGGESVTATGIPKGMQYVVTEEDYSSEGYVTSKTGQQDTIVENETITASFTNTRDAGKLLIAKSVAGKYADKNKYFSFKVSLNSAGSFPYAGSKTGFIKDGDVIQLKHNEHIIISDIPVGTAYSVTESGNSGYAVYVTHDVGLIKLDPDTENITAVSFTNIRSTVPKTGVEDDTGILYAMMGLSLVGMGTVLTMLCRKRRRNGSR